MFGLDPDTISNIKEAFSQLPEIEKVLLYGSRAKGDHKNGSDIDITLLGKNLSLKTIYKLDEELYQLYLPYTFDISIFTQIDNNDLIEHILRVGKTFYTQNNSRLPKGWNEKKLGDDCNFVRGPFGGSLKKSCFREEGNAVYEQQHAIYNQFNEIRYYVDDNKFEEMKRFELLSGDLIMSCSGTMGKVAIVPDNIKKGIINQALLKLTPSNHLNVEYLKYWMTSNSFQESLAKHTVGAAIKNVASVKILKQIEIPLPPLPEQKRIVAILDKAFAAIAKAKANAEQNLKNTKELFESYLQGVFDNKCEGWEERFLEVLADEKCSLSYGIVQPGNEFPNGLPVIRPTDLSSRFIKIEGLKRIDPKLAEAYKRTTLLGDELLLCVRGSTGVVSVSTKELMGANVTRGIVPIRFNSEIINQEFGYYLLISNYIQKQIKAMTYGAALMQINIRDLRKILTPYPSLKEQQTIVKKLDALSDKTKKLEAIYQQKTEDLEELKKSVLQKAFNGELTMDNGELIVDN